jgi:hypothetical protein
MKDTLPKRVAWSCLFKGLEMPDRLYHNLTLYFDHIEGTENDPAGRIERYSLRVFDSPVGEGEKEEEVLIQDWDQIETWRTALADRSITSREFERFSSRLGELMFPPYARDLYQRSLIKVQNDGLRIRLRLIPELAFLPWEYFLIKAHEGEISQGLDHPALDHRISIVRHEAISIPAPPFSATPHRRVIFAMASPEPYEIYPKLDLAGEQTAIKERLNRVSGVKAEYYPDYDERGAPIGITKDWINSILGEPADVFHFSGHGIYEPDGQDGNGGGHGLLVMADENNQADEVQSNELGSLLARGQIRLVVLDACETGERDRFRQWSSVAMALLKVGIPAVVAMQFSVYDDLTKIFASKLYEYLVGGLDIDEAVTQGRRAVFFADSKERDWGAPVLYMRNSGGKIFPPVTDEKARLLAEKASQQDTARDEFLLGWLQRGALASSAQLDVLQRGGDTLNLSRLDAILLLQSALAADRVPTFWVEQLRKTGKDWLEVVDASPEILEEETDSAARQLGLTGQLPALPENVGALAWSAAVHPDNLTSETAALALLASDPENALTKIQMSVSRSPMADRRRRRARLIGRLAEASTKISQEIPKRLDNFQDRAAVWWWRARCRTRRTRTRLVRWILGGAFGAGLALAIWRGILAIINTRTMGTEFAIESYWGFIIGLFTTIGMVMASPLLLLDLDDLTPEQEKRRNRLAVLLGAVGFSLANGVVMWMNGLGISFLDLLAFLLTSFLAGLVIAIGLHKQPWVGWPEGGRKWLKRLLLPALLLALLQAPVLCQTITRPEGGYLLKNALWQVSTIFESSQRLENIYYYLSPLRSAFDACSPGELGVCCLNCPDVNPILGCFEQWLSILDAAVTGVVLIWGMMTGMHFPLTRIGKTWKALVSRLGLSD